MKKIRPPRRYPIITELNSVAPTPDTILVADTDKYCLDLGEEGIVLPDALRTDFDRTFEIGTITSVGSAVEDLKPGDVVLYRTYAAYRLPNGLFPAFMFKIDYYAVICKVGEDPDYLAEALAVEQQNLEAPPPDAPQAEDKPLIILPGQENAGRNPHGRIII